MSAKGHEHERVRCPGCWRTIAVSHAKDGSAWFRPHNTPQGERCALRSYGAARLSVLGVTSNPRDLLTPEQKASTQASLDRMAHQRRAAEANTGHLGLT